MKTGNEPKEKEEGTSQRIKVKLIKKILMKRRAKNVKEVRVRRKDGLRRRRK
jgi:hypothetical protein